MLVALIVLEKHTEAEVEALRQQSIYAYRFNGVKYRCRERSECENKQTNKTLERTRRQRYRASE